MTFIIVPNGHTWLRDIAEEFQWKYLAIHQHVKIKDVSKPKWEEDCILESYQCLQVAFANKEMTAHFFGEEDIESVTRGFWAREDKTNLIMSGMFGYKENYTMPLFVETSSYNAFVAVYESAAGMPGYNPVDFSKGKANHYITPFVKMILEAINIYNIHEKQAPSIKVLEDWFKKQKLPDGRFISPNQAKMMATFSRPPHLMKGGYQKAPKSGD